MTSPKRHTDHDVVPTNEENPQQFQEGIMYCRDCEEEFVPEMEGTGFYSGLPVCKSCDKEINCVETPTDACDHMGRDGCSLDRCENCGKPIHHLDCMAIVDFTPNESVWCYPCYNDYYTVEHVHLRIGRTITQLENGGYQNFSPNRTVGDIIYELNTEFRTWDRIEEDEQWLTDNLPDILYEIDEYDIPLEAIQRLLDIRYPRRHEGFGYPYSHWFGRVTLQVWRIKWKGAKFESVEDKPYIHTLQPWTTLEEIALAIHERRFEELT